MSFKAQGKARAEPAAPQKVVGDGALAAAFEAMADGVVLVADDRSVTLVNRAAAGMNGIDAADFRGRPIGDLARDSTLDWAPVLDVLDGGGAGDVLTTNADGRPFLVTIRSKGQGGIVIAQRDLEVFDHARRRASSASADNTFRFLNDRAVRPDFARQRALSHALDDVLTRGERAMQQGARIMLLGESGVGKTEIARHLNEFLNEKTAPFVHVNCGAIPDTLFESEVFGYERGSFTGALTSGKRGLIEQADGGTLFLDEVGEIPLTVQAKLLKFLEDGTVHRIGAARPKVVRVRVITATNRDLAEMVEAARFRRDLYYRLAVITLNVRPLREVPELIDHLVDRSLQLVNQRRPERLDLTPKCRDRLRAYGFPGNIRELHNIIQHLSVTADRTADTGNLPESVLMDRVQQAAATDDDGEHGLKVQVRRFERDLIDDAVARFGSKRKAAQALGVDIGTIVRKTRTDH